MSKIYDNAPTVYTNFATARMEEEALEEDTQPTEAPTVDSSLAETVQNILTVSNGRLVFASNDDDVFGIPDEKERDLERGQYEKLRVEVVETNENTKQTKKNVKELREETAMNHADTKLMLEEQHGDMMLTNELLHRDTQDKVEDVQNHMGDIFEVIGSMGANITTITTALEHAKLSENTEKIKELEMQLANSVGMYDALKRKLVQLQGQKIQLVKDNKALAQANLKLQCELDASNRLLDQHGLTPAKPRRGLAKAPINLPPPAPATKREAPAVMVAIGRKTKMALQEADVNKRANSGKFMF